MQPANSRVGVVSSQDPEDVTVGSGWSSSLVSALSDVVAEVVPIQAELPARAHRLLYLASVATRLRVTDIRDVRGGAHRVSNAATLGGPLTASRRIAAWRRLRGAGTLDGVVQRGCDMLLPRSARVVTFEDSTLLQAVRAYPWSHLQGLSQSDLDRYAKRQKQVYRRVWAACTATHWVARSVIDDYGVDEALVKVVGLGRNYEIEPVPRNWSSPRFLFVGVDWERKNGPAVLHAFARVREHAPHARLDVVGGHPRLDEPGVTGHGQLSRASPEDRSRLITLFDAATVFVMPSLHEPAGTVYAEAAGAGIASIGSTNGGAATVIGEGGRLVDPHSPEQLINSMQELADPTIAAQVGSLAQQRSHLFTWRSVAERLMRALEIPGTDTTDFAHFL